MSTSSLSTASVGSAYSSSLVEIAPTNSRKRKLSESSSDPTVTKFAALPADSELTAKTMSVSSQTLSSSSAGSSSPKPMVIEDVSPKKTSIKDSVSSSSSSSSSLQTKIISTTQSRSLDPDGVMSLAQYQEENPLHETADYDQYVERVRKGYYKTGPFSSSSASSSSSSPSVKLEKDQEAISSSSSSKLTRKSPLDWDKLFSLIEPSSQPASVSIFDMVANIDNSYFEKFQPYNKQYISTRLHDLITKDDKSEGLQLLPRVLTDIVIDYAESFSEMTFDQTFEEKLRIHTEITKFQRGLSAEQGEEYLKLCQKIYARKTPDVFYKDWKDVSYSYDSYGVRVRPGAEKAINLKCAVDLIKTKPDLARAVRCLGWNMQRWSCYPQMNMDPIMEIFPSDFEVDQYEWDLKSFRLIAGKADQPNKPFDIWHDPDSSKPGHITLAEKLASRRTNHKQQPVPVKEEQPSSDPLTPEQERIAEEQGRNACRILDKCLSLWREIHGKPIINSDSYETLVEKIYKLKSHDSSLILLDWPDSSMSKHSDYFQIKFSGFRDLSYGIMIQNDFVALASQIEQQEKWDDLIDSQHSIIENYPDQEKAKSFKSDLETYIKRAPEEEIRLTKLAEQNALYQERRQRIHKQTQAYEATRRKRHEDAENQRVEKARKDDEAIPVLGAVVAAVKGWLGSYNPLPYRQ